MEYNEAFNQALKKDLEFGLKCEDELLNVFREKIDNNFCKTNKGAIVDYISPRCYLELKSRNCNHDKYNEMMIGENKIQFAMKTKKKFYIVYNFKDGIYYYLFNKEDLDLGKIRFSMGGRTDRGKDERKICAFIDVDLLIPL